MGGPYRQGNVGEGQVGIGPYRQGSTDSRGQGSMNPSQQFSGFDDHSAYRAEGLARLRNDLSTMSRDALSETEKEGLLLMREEEKIARDVYLRLFDRWGLRPFQNISGAEQTHMDAVLALLDHFGLPDPAQGLSVGRFNRPDLQALYDQLITRGEQSLADAVCVGLLIEELDIKDLQEARAKTDKLAIHRVFAELERGSRNHLRAFYRWKQRLGINYVPQHLPNTVFEKIGQSEQEF